MRDLLEKNRVQLYSTENEEKSSVVERWNRTSKRNMWKYFSANNTMNYIDILPNLIKKNINIITDPSSIHPHLQEHRRAIDTCTRVIVVKIM